MFTELLSQCIQEAGVEYAHLEPPCPEEEIAQAEAAVSVAEAVHRKVQPLPCRAADRPAHTKQASNSTGAATA